MADRYEMQLQKMRINTILYLSWIFHISEYIMLQIFLYPLDFVNTYLPSPYSFKPIKWQ